MKIKTTTVTENNKELKTPEIKTEIHI